MSLNPDAPERHLPDNKECQMREKCPKSRSITQIVFPHARWFLCSFVSPFLVSLSLVSEPTSSAVQLPVRSRFTNGMFICCSGQSIDKKIIPASMVLLPKHQRQVAAAVVYMAAMYSDSVLSVESIAVIPARTYCGSVLRRRAACSDIALSMVAAGCASVEVRMMIAGGVETDVQLVDCIVFAVETTYAAGWNSCTVPSMGPCRRSLRTCLEISSDPV